MSTSVATRRLILTPLACRLRLQAEGLWAVWPIILGPLPIQHMG